MPFLTFSMSLCPHLLSQSQCVLTYPLKVTMSSPTLPRSLCPHLPSQGHYVLTYPLKVSMSSLTLSRSVCPFLLSQVHYALTYSLKVSVSSPTLSRSVCPHLPSQGQYVLTYPLKVSKRFPILVELLLGWIIGLGTKLHGGSNPSHSSVVGSVGSSSWYSIFSFKLSNERIQFGTSSLFPR